MTAQLAVAFAMRPGLRDRLFSPAALRRLSEVATFAPDRTWHDFSTPEARHDLAGVQVLVTGWGCPQVTTGVVEAMPELRAVVHAGGTVKPHLPAEFWEAGVPVSTAADANALPVAEYTVAAILFANKRVPSIAADYRCRPREVDWTTVDPTMGNYGKRVGVVGASRIGRRVIELLRPFSLEVVVHDPYLADMDTPVDVPSLSLDELMAASDVVTLHAPDLPGNHHMVDRRRLALMPDGATLINTARGGLVDHDALVEELSSGRLYAVLDVTSPEILPAHSPLLSLPNVLVTPHIAGSLGAELTRLGDTAVEEVHRLAAGEPLAHQVALESLARGA